MGKNQGKVIKKQDVNEKNENSVNMQTAKTDNSQGVNKNNNLSTKQGSNKGNTGNTENTKQKFNQKNPSERKNNVSRNKNTNNQLLNKDIKQSPIKEEKRDTLGDTKIFQRITREDIEKEKKRQAILKENEIKKQENQKNPEIKKQEDPKKIEIKKQENLKILEDKKSQEDKKNQEEKKQTKDIKYNNYPQTNKKLNNYEDNNKEKQEKKGPLIAILTLLIIALILLVASTIFGVINKSSNKIIKGVYINNIEVSNLTKEEALAKVDTVLNNEDSNYIIVTRGEYSKEIHLSDIEGKFNTKESIDEAYNLGRAGDVVSNNYKTIGTMINNKNFSAGFECNKELLEKNINDVAIELPGVAADASYIIEGNKIIIQNGKDGVQLKTTEFEQNIIDAFANGSKTVEIPVEQVGKKEIDIQKIHDDIYIEPKNAYYTSNPPQIYKEEDGLDFAISIEEAEKMLSQDREVYEIELKVIKPDITMKDLDEAFPDQLATFTTNYGTGDVNRNTNIAVAARSINSVIVMPGETFSFNDLIGECSTRTGYKQSTIYLNGELSTGIGGGICQVSTTLYNAVLRANLEVVERKNHSLGVTYVPAGHDAMVSIGSSDFKFKNNRSYPVKVVAFVGTGSITCQIHGLKQDVEYDVKLASTTIESTETKYKVQTYKIMYLNGVEISRTLISTDTYKRH